MIPPAWLSFIDVAFVVAVLLFAWGGFQKGFAGQIAHILTFLIIGAVLLFAYPHICGYLEQVFQSVDESYILWAIMAVVAVLAIGVFLLMSKMLAKLLKTQLSERSDHAYGFILGLFRGVLVALLVMILLVVLGPQRIEDNFCDKSYTGKFVCYQLVPRIRPHMSRAVWSDDIQKIRQEINEKREETTRARTQP